MAGTHAGETRVSRAHRRRRGSWLAWVERQLLAAVFAEEGLHREARRLSGGDGASGGDEALQLLLGAHGVRMFCGSLSPAALAARR